MKAIVAFRAGPHKKLDAAAAASRLAPTESSSGISWLPSPGRPHVFLSFFPFLSPPRDCLIPTAQSSVRLSRKAWLSTCPNSCTRERIESRAARDKEEETNLDSTGFSDLHGRDHTRSVSAVYFLALYGISPRNSRKEKKRSAYTMRISVPLLENRGGHLYCASRGKFCNQQSRP